MASSKMLVFRVAEQEFAVDIRDVREVIAMPEVSGLPRARPPVVGVFNLRGSIVTAVDGGEALGIASRANERSRAVVVDADAHAVGVLVDAASEVLTVDEDAVQPASHLASEDVPARGVVVVGARAIVLLDLARLVGEQAVRARAADGAEAPEVLNR